MLSSPLELVDISLVRGVGALTTPGARRIFASFVAVSLSLLIAPAGAVAAPTRAPHAWDPKLVPIVREVEKIRGLSFDRPVPVTYLGDAAFDKRVAVDEKAMSTSDKK